MGTEIIDENNWLCGGEDGKDAEKQRGGSDSRGGRIYSNGQGGPNEERRAGAGEGMGGEADLKLNGS